MGLVAPLHQYIDDLIHHSAQEALERQRHRVFITQRLFGALLVFAAFPLYLALRGAPSLLEVAAFGLVLVPLVLAYFLSATGKYETALILSAGGLTAVILGLVTFQIISFPTAAFWLAVVPLECALVGSRRSLLAACMFALSAMALLTAFPQIGAPAHPLPLAGSFAAAIYLLIIGWSARHLVHSAQLSAVRERERYHLVAGNMMEAVVQHGPQGEILSASAGGVEDLFATSSQSLLDRGFFERLHVADRPAYLTALANARDGHQQTVPLRVRTATGHYVHIEMISRSVRRIDERVEVITVMRETAAPANVSENSAEIHAVSSKKACSSPDLRVPVRGSQLHSEMKVSA